MTPATVALVRENFSAAAPAADELTRRFYARLFELDPALRPLFPGDLSEQRRKLAGALAFLVGALDRPTELVPALQALGRRHGGYGVDDRHYDTVAAALLDTLEAMLGAAFTPAARAAWTDVYGTAAGVMKAAAADRAAA